MRPHDAAARRCERARDNSWAQLQGKRTRHPEQQGDGHRPRARKLLFGVAVQVHDPMALPEEAEREYGLRLLPREALPPAAAVVFGVAHDCFVAEGWRLIAGLLRNGTGIVL